MATRPDGGEIESITPLRRGWASVSAGGETFIVPVSILRRMGVVEGMEADIRALRDQALKAQREAAARDSARFLGMAERSVARLRSHLLRRGYSPCVVEAEIERDIAAGWVDDARFARIWAASRPGRGTAALRSGLAARGVTGDAARAALDPVDEDAEAESLVEMVRRRYGSLDGRVALRRAVGFLRRRGFSVAVSLRIARRALAGDGGHGGR
ncbi:regulatory protein RecX [Candidatus Fermentibacteria bacterium]|nr:regulatory protein RecX [Candidatus Fermentibacteria bacterium]